jgi:hypothetical protein
LPKNEYRIAPRLAARAKSIEAQIDRLSGILLSDQTYSLPSREQVIDTADTMSDLASYLVEALNMIVAHAREWTPDQEE